LLLSPVGLALFALAFHDPRSALAANRKLSGQGRTAASNYTGGGWLITGAGFADRIGGWSVVIYAAILLLLIPMSAGITER
jgi:hypothetical protein